MNRVVALIDGEHYPPVVRFALSALSHEFDVVGAAFLGGTEKVDSDSADAATAYGVPLVTAATADEALLAAIERFEPDAIVDLSDEPVLTAADRFRLASIALSRGVEYRGADFRFRPPRAGVTPCTPTLGLIGTGKRVGKTAISAYVARHLAASGRDIAVLAMGRGGPSAPEVIHGEQVHLSTADLLALAREGKHAASDNYEDAVMSRVTTIGCRRCGGGLAGETFFGNVTEGARLADSLGKELLVIEGSGAAIPPVHLDATILVVGAAQGPGYVTDFFGPYRLSRADLVVIAGAEGEASGERTEAIRDAISHVRPGLPAVATTFRPAPVEPVAGRRVFFATTAPEAVLPALVEHLESEHGCDVVGSSVHLSDRRRLREDISAASGSFDLLVTELKAAAIDVVASVGEEIGIPTVLCDNVPVAVDGHDLGQLVDRVVERVFERASARRGTSA